MFSIYIINLHLFYSPSASIPVLKPPKLSLRLLLPRVFSSPSTFEIVCERRRRDRLCWHFSVCRYQMMCKRLLSCHTLTHCLIDLYYKACGRRDATNKTIWQHVSIRWRWNGKHKKFGLFRTTLRSLEYCKHKTVVIRCIVGIKCERKVARRAERK